jgi:Tol biopolymer transport system component
MLPRLASAVLLPATVAAVLLALTFSSAGSARVGSSSVTGTFPGRNGEIVFASLRVRNGPWQLYVMRPDGTRQRPVTGAAGSAASPAWSPDGKWIAFLGDSKKICPYVELMRVDGTGLRRLTHDRGCYYPPAWSPDGTRIAFLRALTPVGGKIPVFALGTINVNGSGLRVFAHGSGLDGDPVWSPDGTTIAFVRSWPQAIWLMDADGTNQRQLTLPPQKPYEQDQDAYPTWSPDGNWIAFSRAHEPHMDKTGSTRYREDIYLIQPDGTGLRRLTRLDGANTSPAWSPDGKRIAFDSDRAREDLTDHLCDER